MPSLSDMVKCYRTLPAAVRRRAASSVACCARGQRRSNRMSTRGNPPDTESTQDYELWNEDRDGPRLLVESSSRTALEEILRYVEAGPSERGR